MGKRRRFSSPVVGGITLLVTFAVLCLTVFAVLSVGTVRADGRLSDASARAVQAYYEADAYAELIFARIRAGETPEGVEMADGLCRYACRISDTQVLCVTLRQDTEGWSVLQWQAVSTVEWQGDDSLPVWDGNTFVIEEGTP